MLTFPEFEILCALERNDNLYSRRDVAIFLGYSIGKTQIVLKKLEEKGLLDNYTITEAGRKVLSPFRVKRAVILAAGKGSRLYPLTQTTPKPLINVNGKMIIETILDALLEAEITDITIVVGYLKEKFDVLKEKYPFLHFVENPEYNEANNISSALRVKHLFASSYILDSDLIINSPSVITKYQYASNYVGIKVDRTDDWCIVEKNGVVKAMKRGGENVYLMRDVVYFSALDGERFEKDCETVYSMPGGKERYYDEVALDVFKNSYKFYVREIGENDVIEIDSLSDLKSIDKSYENIGT